MRAGGAIAATGLLAALAVSGCGGGGGGHKTTSTATASPPPSSAEADAVKAAATAIITDPKRTCDLLTPRALSIYTGGVTGAAGLAKCRVTVARSQLPGRATVVVLSVKGLNASVGYVTKLVTGSMLLKKRGGQWLMSQVATVPAP